MGHSSSIQFVNDEKGKVRAVLVPIGEWEKLQKELRFLREQHLMKTNLAKALLEVEQMRKAKTPKIDMKMLLDEC